MRHVPTPRPGSILLHLPFLVLAALSVVFYEERLYADSGYYLIKVINHESFHIEHGRLVLMFSQIWPLLAVQVGMGLKAILLVYSLGHVLFFYLLFVIVKHILKDNASALALILLQFAGIMQSFFAPQFEMYYATGFLILFVSILMKVRLTVFTVIGLVLLEILILSGHPMSFFLFFFALVYLYLEEGREKGIPYLLFLGIFILGITIKLLTFSEYEESKILFHLNFNANKQYQVLFRYNYLAKLGHHLATYYPDVIFLFIMASVHYISRKQIWRWILMFVFAVGYILFMNAMYPAIEASRYYEQVYFPFATIIVFSFLYDFYRQRGQKWLVYLVVAGIVVYHTLVILEVGVPFRQRNIQMKEMIIKSQRANHKLVMFNEKENHQPYSNFGWSYPIESLLISSQGRLPISVTLISQEDYLATMEQGIFQPGDYIFRVYEPRPLSFLNKRYFNLETGDYWLLESRSPDAGK